MANLALNVTSSFPLCVRVGREGAEKRGVAGAGWASGVLMFTTHLGAASGWSVAKAADAPRAMHTLDALACELAGNQRPRAATDLVTNAASSHIPRPPARRATAGPGRPGAAR